VDHQTYARDRRLIASTPPPPKNLVGRPRGGIYLLGTHAARSAVDRVETTEHSITLHRGRQSVTGVYFPPTTISTDEVASLLTSLRRSTAILGDINTRFRDPLYQDGEPGRPERLYVFTEFLTETGY
jgi:hypothetical protein